MMLTHAAITGVNGWLPEEVLSNADLEKMVDTNDAWIRSRTGIQERRMLGDGKGVTDMADKAVEGLLRKTNTRPEEVDLVVFATITPDMMMPDAANMLCDKVGMTNACGFDLRAACSGFVYAITVGAQFIQTGMYKKVIVVGADKMSSIIDYEDRSTCIIFGDGAAAVMLEPSDEPVGVMDSILKGDGAGKEHLYITAGGSLKPASAETVANREHYVVQVGRPVFKMAVRSMADVVSNIIARNGLTKDDIAWIVPHQANKRIINAVADALDFPMEKVTMNIHKYGNTTAATIPLCLWEWEDRLKKGDNLVLTAFGGGYTWGAVLVKWAYNPKK